MSNLKDTPSFSSDLNWLRYILDSADLSIISTDTTGIIRSCNQGALRRLGYKSEELVGIHTPAIIHDSAEVFRRAKTLSEELGVKIEPGFDAFIAKARLGQTDENEWSYIRKDGTRYPVILSVTALRDDKGNIEGYLGIGRDLSMQKAMEQKIMIQQYELEKANEELREANKKLSEIIQVDPLTQLLNRRGFHACFEQELERIKRHNAPLSLLLMDVDHFKQYNDQYGHLEGDRLLKQLSVSLRNHARAVDCVARFGGEEFLIILPETDTEQSRVIAERYRLLVTEIQSLNCPITASLGVTTLHSLGDKMTITQLFDQVIEEADRAMYASKAAGRNRVTHFSDMPA